ncbi:hypothetical protein RHSIM_Rhsim03G0210500 [Rhododendron simsii]|uniref:Uncharacterized protein n=1 Tax=Rhododendron simsii TaxID=118357 RepID=A0A834LVK3_RHOSS|nr:hypothetical protein RHSIM_Rhsim03G0210500 [Rhododendron simsii]
METSTVVRFSRIKLVLCLVISPSSCTLDAVFLQTLDRDRSDRDMDLDYSNGEAIDEFSLGYDGLLDSCDLSTLPNLPSSVYSHCWQNTPITPFAQFRRTQVIRAVAQSRVQNYWMRLNLFCDYVLSFSLCREMKMHIFTLETLHNLKLFYCSYVKNIENFQPALFRRCCCCWFFLFSLAAGVFCFLQMKKRKEKSQVTHERKKQLMKLRLKAEKVAAFLVEVVFQCRAYAVQVSCICRARAVAVPCKCRARF